MAVVVLEEKMTDVRDVVIEALTSELAMRAIRTPLSGLEYRRYFKEAAREYYEDNATVLSAALLDDRLDREIPEFVGWAKKRFPDLNLFPYPMYR